jgi:hypothetical protein
MEYTPPYIDSSLVDVVELGEELLDKAKTVGGTIQQQVSRVLQDEGRPPSHAAEQESSDETPL